MASNHIYNSQDDLLLQLGKTRFRSVPLNMLRGKPEKPKPFNIEKEWARVKDVWNHDKAAWARYAGVKLPEEEQ